MKDMAAILALLNEFIEAVQPGLDGEARGVVWFDSFRGAYCPTCDPWWPEGATGHQHQPDCPFARLLKEMAG